MLIPPTGKIHLLAVEEAVAILRVATEVKLDLEGATSREHLAKWLDELIALRKFRAATEEARRHLP